MNNNQNLIRWPVYRLEELIPANEDERAALLPPGERYVKRLNGSDIETAGIVEYPDDDSLQLDEISDALFASMEGSLNSRQQRILRLRFGLGDSDEQTLEEVGQVEGVTRERIRQIQAQAIGKLKFALPPWLRREFEQEEHEENHQGD